MNNKTKSSNKCHTNISTLFIFLIDLFPIENENVETKLIKNKSDINKIINSSKEDKFKYIYFDFNNIHKILYDLDTVIPIDDNNIDNLKNFENLFYLDLLILSNSDIINYVFSKKLIQELYIYTNKTISNKLFLIIILKIIIDLINSYKSCDLYNENEDEEELVSMENECKAIINANISEFEKLGINIEEEEILSLKSEDIYIYILNALIKSRKFEDYEYINGIMNDLRLEKIFITKKMFKELKKTLNMESEYIKPYIIRKIDDLFDIKILNLYYILIKFIFKNAFYFCQVPLLLCFRGIIIHLIKTKLNLLCYYKSKYETNQNINKKLEFLIKKATDTEYYYNKYTEHFQYCKLSAILFFYKIFFFESHKKEILDLEKALEFLANEKCDILLNYENLVDRMEIRFEIMTAFYKIEMNIGYLFINQKKGEKFIKSWRLIEKSIKEKKIKKLKRNCRIDLYILFKDQNKINTLQKIFTEKEINYFLEEVENMLGRNSQVKTNKPRIIAKAMDEVNFHFDYKIEESSLIIQSFSITDNTKSIDQSQSKLNNSLITKKVEEEFISPSFREKLKMSNLYKIIEHCEVIGKHENAEFFRQLSNGQYISGGKDKYIIWYDKFYQQIESIYMKDFQNNAYEIENTNNNEEEEINIISFSNNKINFLTLDIKNKKGKIIGKISNSSVISIYYLNSQKSLILVKDKIGTFNNKWNKDTPNIETKLKVDIFYKGGILLKNETDKIFAFTSNDTISLGKNKMIFYNCTKNVILGEIDKYSFVSSYNNMCEINQVIKVERKILLAACGGDEKGEKKNGILVINLDLDSKLEYKLDFIDTQNFEVYCFCQILEVKNENSIYEDITNTSSITIKETDFVFIGGFDKDKREGSIKLYKIRQSLKIPDFVEIQYIQDIYIKPDDNFKRFDGKISSITQSKFTGNILITCWDGTVHMFRPPNLDYFKN